MPQQIADAISFLQIHQAQLQPLIEITEVENKILDFAVKEPNAFVQCDVFPAQLLKLVGELDLDLEVSRYAKTSD